MDRNKGLFNGRLDSGLCIPQCKTPQFKNSGLLNIKKHFPLFGDNDGKSIILIHEYTYTDGVDREDMDKKQAKAEEENIDSNVAIIPIDPPNVYNIRNCDIYYVKDHGVLRTTIFTAPNDPKNDVSLVPKNYHDHDKVEITNKVGKIISFERNKKRKHKIALEDNCLCITKYRYKGCIAIDQPVDHAFFDELHRQASDRLGTYVQGKDWVSLSNHDKRWCYYWHYGINFFGGKNVKDTLPDCVVNHVRKRFPHGDNTT